MHRPSEFLTSGCRKQLVFLRVIEVCDVESRLVLAEGGIRHRALSVGFERAEVVLETGDQGNVAHRCVGERGEEVTDHAGVHLDVELLGCLTGPGRKEDPIGQLAGQHALQVGGGAQVRLDPAHAGQGAAAAAGEGENLPALSRQLVDDGGAGYAGSSDDEGGTGAGFGGNNHYCMQPSKRSSIPCSEPLAQGPLTVTTILHPIESFGSPLFAFGRILRR